MELREEFAEWQGRLAGLAQALREAKQWEDKGGVEEEMEKLRAENRRLTEALEGGRELGEGAGLGGRTGRESVGDNIRLEGAYIH
jgi:uncharacterized coiled-coil DUF342 family protein